jgi:hypothetical protein
MARIESFRRPECFCPNCNKPTDAAMDATNAKSRPPEDGDVAICFYCSHVAIYDGDKLRNPNDKEMEDIAGDIDVVHAINMIGLVRGAKNS